MEEMDVISSHHETHHDPGSSGINLVVDDSNEDSVSGQYCSDNKSLPLATKQCRDQTTADNAVTNVCTATSDDCERVEIHSGSFLPEKTVISPINESSIMDTVVNTLSDTVMNLNLPGSKCSSSDYLSSEKVNVASSSELDVESNCTEESLAPDNLIIHESDSTVNSYNCTDSLKTCADDDSSLSDCTEISKEEHKSNTIKEDINKTFVESKPSSEIKERIMSYLNKHLESYEFGDKEQESSRMLVKDQNLKSKNIFCNEISCTKLMKEDPGVLLKSSKPCICLIKDGSLNLSKSEFGSTAENPLINYNACKPKDFQAQKLSNAVTSCPTVKEQTMSLKEQTISETSRGISQLSMSNRACPFLKSCEVVFANKSSSQSPVRNSNSSMSLTNEANEMNNESIADSFVTAPSNQISFDSSESEMQLSSSPSNTNSSIQGGLESNTFLLESKENVESPSEGDSSSHFVEKPSSSSGIYNTSSSCQSLENFYNRVGTTSTNSSFSSWGKLSFQPFTIPSINSPIFCSRSHNDGKISNTDSFNKHVTINDSGTGIGKSPGFLLKGDSSSRKTKSTEALFSNNPSSIGTDSVFGENISGKSSSKVSNLHFVSPVVHTESSWSQQSMNQNTLLGSEKQFSAINSPVTSCSSFNTLISNGPFNGISENPFLKKPSESIGIFSSSQESAFTPFPSIFNPKLPYVFSPKREKVSDKVCGDAPNKPTNVIKETAKFPFQLNCESKQDFIKCPPKFNFKYMEQSSEAKKFAFNPGIQSKVESNDSLLSQDHKIEIAASQANVTSSPLLFKLSGEKPKSLNTHRFTLQRVAWKAKSHKQHDKGFTKFIKEANTITSAIDLPNAPFKAAYGSDVVLDKWSQNPKNVIVRYQNIVLMKEHLNVSPEELRHKYYNKTHVTGPFKFCASSEYSERHSYKRLQNKEIQTDENLLSKRFDLSEIWRALECPVCLDVVMPPVYQCEQGHHACLTCWNKVVTCPLCKRHKSVTRNYMAEALIDQIPLPCKYHIEGCKETVSRANKISHEETCLFRMYQCPVPSCNQAHSYQNMCNHFKKIHKSVLHHEGHSVGKGEKFCDVLYKDHLSSSLIHAFDIAKWGLFFLREVVTKHARALFVQVMPASPEPAAYFYHLEVCDHHDCRKECYKGRVFSMGKSTQEIVEEEEYLSLSELILKTVKKSAPLKIVVTIWQLKPAFTLSTE